MEQKLAITDLESTSQFKNLLIQVVQLQIACTY